MRSERTIAMDEGTVRVLKKHYKQQLRDRMMWGEAWAESGKVFCRRGRLAASHPNDVSDQFEDVLTVARPGCLPMRLHDLRHGAALADARRRVWT
jgi:hypothetical protein